MPGDQQHHDLLMASIEQAIGRQSDSGTLAGFAGAYFATPSYQILSRREPAALAEVARSQHALAATRAPGEIRVQVVPAASGDPGALARLETVCEDMPFIVDSLGIAVRDAGSSVDWSVHPVLYVRRDAEGRLQDAAPDAGSGGICESFVCMEIAPLADDAAYEALRVQAEQTLRDIALAVADFDAMRERAAELGSALTPPIRDLPDEWVHEARDFALWLREHHFTFLGYAFAPARYDGDQVSVGNDPERSLGLLRPDARFGDTGQILAPAEELNRYAGSPRLVVVTKAQARSHIHHPLTLDAISIKQMDADGRLIGTHRFLGLFSSDVYVDRPQNIPVIRQKVDEVLRRSRLAPDSHSGKKLRDILHQLPRDELFQSSEQELHTLCSGVRALRERHRLRLFLRRDRYGRFYSALVYVPRERYSPEMRDRICEELRAALDGHSVERAVEFPRGEMLARIHANVQVHGRREREVDVAALERQLVAATRTWPEQLREALGTGSGVALAFADGFDAGYQQENAPLDAAVDIHYLQQLDADVPILPRLVTDDEAVGPACPTEMRLYARGESMALSDVLPTLENFGLRVMRQSPHAVRPAGQDRTLWVQVFEVRFAGDCALEPVTQKRYFEDALLRCLRGETEDDGLHSLVLGAGLDARRIVLLRTLTRYLLQTGLPYGRDMLERLLAEHAAIARDLVALFEARFDPDADDDREAAAQAARERIEPALEAVTSLDADRALRAYVGVVEATLRTNYYQQGGDGRPKPWVSIKLDPRRMPELPEPRPVYEAFVYAPEVEGVHLRGGPVARGGLRWSDRPADFRTEVLGLMKAQMVKNAIIVPVGAKGGFVVKRRDFPDREAFAAAGKACYQTFIRGLLDITDNRDGDTIVPPPRVVRADGDDPYLVVAADKGTATFSDTANALAAEYDFWLGDAFASGGSAGYDHKVMGITARGAWESVKRHFRELGKDIQSEPFTVVGIGDMAGDVFGNGMLLSERIRLVAAFNHMHIFIDPEPDPARSFAERKRLFGMGRSTWEDYDRDAISAGGGIWRRDAKRIELPPEARAALGIEAESVRPNELLRAILLAPVELLWNGGIGTYVKAHTESHQAVGDRANDAIRVDGRELRCRVVGEGGNLGCTQLGRIEYALAGCDGRGGRINTDAIDNSGGVHSSDREVNIKIPLNACMAAGTLERDARNALLESMTEDVATAVLADNHEQSLAVSLISARAAARLDEHAHTMRALERESGLVRGVEFLPDDEALNERRTRRQGLARPEIAVVLAYAKNALFDDLVGSAVPDDPGLAPRLDAYFPAAMRGDYADAIAAHRLRREIIATDLANQAVNRMGFSFVHRLAEDQGAQRPAVLKAFALAWQLMGAEHLVAAADALDGSLAADVQLGLYERLAGLVKHVTIWALAEHLPEQSITDSMARLGEPLARVAALIPDGLPPSYREDWEHAVARWTEKGVPEATARRFADTLVLGSAPDIVETAAATGTSPEVAAAVYFAVGERLHVLWLLSSIVGLQVSGRYQALARANLREDTYRLHRRVAERVLDETEGDDGGARVAQWLERQGAAAEGVIARIEALQTHTPHDFMSLTVGVRALRQVRAL
ncbi:NAD-glutamate dehydrogenase [Algiphilus sp.]|uniref:NAD-glutamate dehydrogenase n=1 Tax=Algiphilus sp. TaxID=1872431 RepID=UPI003C4D3184